jgi:hypothetical protein
MNDVMFPSCEKVVIDIPAEDVAMSFDEDGQLDRNFSNITFDTFVA